MTSNLSSDTWASIIGGGLAAALLTLLFNALWDVRKERKAEDWEWRRYRANLVHGSTFGLMELFFAAKTEIDYLVGALNTLVITLQQLEQEADALVRVQAGHS